MAQTVKNVDYALVGKGTSTTPPANDISDLADGQLGVFNSGGTAGAITSGDKFVIALGGPNGKAKFVSEVIDPTQVELVTRRGYFAAVQQKNALGYNGTSGSIDDTLASGNLYFVDVYIQEYLTSNTDGRTIKHFQYSSVAGDTQADIASGLFTSAVNNYSREAEDYMLFEMLCDNAGVATTGTLDVVKGSVTAVASVPGDFEVGGFVRLGTATTDPVYRVDAISGNNLTLNTKVQQATQQLAIAAAESITAALGAAANFGITMEGLELEWEIGKSQYKIVRWELGARDFGTTTVTELANPFDGVGEYKQAADAEWFLRGFEGEYNREGFSTIYQSVINATAGVTYDITSLRFQDASLVGFKNEISPKQITMWSPVGADYMDDVVADNGVWPQIKAAVDNTKLSKTTGGPGATTVTPGILDV